MVEILHLAVVICCKNTYTFLLLYTDPKRVLHKGYYSTSLFSANKIKMEKDLNCMY